ncbi:hypothetical protein GCM10009610_53820 [Pseudonocardia xinjiangensis]
MISRLVASIATFRILRRRTGFINRTQERRGNRGHPPYRAAGRPPVRAPGAPQVAPRGSPPTIKEWPDPHFCTDFPRPRLL